MPCFTRIETQEEFERYLHGLLGPIKRKNGWQLAEASGQKGPDKTQRLLRKAQVYQEGIFEVYWRMAKENFASKEGVMIIDDTGFPKSGKFSVGVKHQYCPTLGKKSVCQIGVFLAYSSPLGRVFLDRRLYLPKEWASDKERREKAGVPEEVEFATKPELALDLLFEQMASDFPFRWVCADSTYGDSPTFWRGLLACEQEFVLGYTSTMPVWHYAPTLQKMKAFEVIAQMPKKKWRRLRVKEGSKGFIEYDWTRKLVYLNDGGKKGKRVWLMARRSLSQKKEVKYFICNAAHNVSLLELARVAASRWAIEVCFEEAKDNVGLDEYEVRKWIGWHRHTLFSMMAHLFLALLKKRSEDKKDEELAQLSVPEVRRLLEIALPLPEKTPEYKWFWSLWRRRHNRKALLSHYRIRGHLLVV